MLHYCSAAFNDALLCTVPLRQSYPFDYPSTILGIQYDDYTDAFEDSDCADALQQICRYPLMIPPKPFDDSAGTL